MPITKPFRLFISSTFSDFAKEREILQKEVFPEIKRYASSKSLSFQPIDLRWGVKSEAQLDQRTLDLCLKEVQMCKTHPHPNFLVMLGERYGWIPLPFAIEETEFKTLLEHISDESQKQLLLEWYSLDKNQLPVSYTIKERSGIYAIWENWEEVENELRTILQNAINQTNLPFEQKRKYFLSATEAEVQEGILPYADPTPFQTKVLLEQDPLVREKDPKYTFAFLRHIDPSSRYYNSIYVVDEEDAKKAMEFKQRVKAVTLDTNTLEVQTSQIDANSIEESYLEEFKNSVTQFLKEKIDDYLKNTTTQELCELEEEHFSQERYKEHKLKNFIPQEDTLSAIEEYINNDSLLPFVLYGRSGKGKSAIIAKSIETTRQNSQKKVLYRFVGATPQSTSSKELLLSLFDALGIELRTPQELQAKKKDTQELLLNTSQTQESFEEFSQRAAQRFFDIKEEVVIFIDAIDQLQNPDEFLWIPHTLPKNVKLIISALEDENYKEDSIYFQTLQQKKIIQHKIEDFSESKARQLLLELLQQQNRTLQEEQIAYFIQQFLHVNSPLYVTIAAQEMKHYKSTTTTYQLSTTQKGIIQEFIDNLSKLYHHYSEFVQKTLGYLYASDGLSEQELLKLFQTDIETDPTFETAVAKNQYHTNITKEFPLVHWSRLQAQLKPFFALKAQDGEELLYFFHREFEDVIQDAPYAQKEHEKLLHTLQHILPTIQDETFDTNRWGKLYIDLLANYALRYNEEKEQLQAFAEFLSQTDILKERWIADVIIYGNEKGMNYYKHNKMVQTFSYQEPNLLITKPLYTKDPSRWAWYYTSSLNNLSESYRNTGRTREAIELGEEALSITKPLYAQDPSYWAKDYTISLNNLANSYKDTGKTKEAIELGEEALSITKELYNQDQSLWIELYSFLLNNLAIFYKEAGKIKKAIELEEKALIITQEIYNQDPYWVERYTFSLNELAYSYYNTGKTKKAIELFETALIIRKELYIQNPSRWAKDYTLSLNNLVYTYNDIGKTQKSIKLGKDLLLITKDLYDQDPFLWAETYTRSLNNLALSYEVIGKTKEVIELQTEALSITKELYIQNPSRWAKNYTISLSNIATFYKNIGKIEKAIVLENEALTITKELYNIEPSYWVEDYTHSLNNLAASYYDTGKTKEAIELQKEAFSIRKALYTQEPSYWAKDYTISLNNLAISYSKTGKTKKAIELFTEAYSIALEYLGENHPNTQHFKRELDYLQSQIKSDFIISKKSSSTSQATFHDLLDIAKLITLSTEEEQIGLMEFALALGCIELNKKAQTIFSQIMLLDEIPHETIPEEYREIARQFQKIPYSSELKNLFEQLKTVFDMDEDIGVFRK